MSSMDDSDHRFTGFSADGEFHEDVLFHGRMVMYRDFHDDR